MARVSVLNIELGATRHFRLRGLTRSDGVGELENIAVQVTQNADRYDAAVEGDVLTVLSKVQPGEDTTPPGPDDASLLGAVKIDADGRRGAGVRPVSRTFPLVGHPADAVDIVAEDLDPEDLDREE